MLFNQLTSFASPEREQSFNFGPASLEEPALGVDPYTPILDATKHVDENGGVRELTHRDILREHAMDSDFGEPECIPEESFALSDIEDFVKKIEFSACSPRPWDADRWLKRTPPPKTHFGKKYSHFHSLVDTAITASFERFNQRSLRFAVFQESMHELGIQHTDFRRPIARFSQTKQNWQVENEFVELVWKKTQTADYKASQRFAQIRSASNYASGEKFINTAFGHYSELLIVRVDLGYRQDARHTLSLVDIQAHFEAFLKRRHCKEFNHIFAHMVGYIRKLEHKPRKGHHYHLILFFDGQKVRDDYQFANEVGKYWADTITKGIGVFHNCNANKFGYRGCGIGLIERTDTTKRDILMKLAMGYLAKSDEFCKPAGESIRRFQPSRVTPPKSTTGRPPN